MKVKEGKNTSRRKQHPASQPAAEIRFYRANERPWGVLSNLYRCEVRLDDEVFPSAEHAYQAGKPRKTAVREWILNAPSPSLVAMAAHGLYTWDIVSDWSKVKFDRMRRVLRAKFDQHPDLRALLLDTGDARLVETATVDNLVNRTWGEVNGKGKNMLGVLLMEIRDEIRMSKQRSPRKVSKPRGRTVATSDSGGKKRKV